jgi:putative PIN family toxin of toxin-antitoxin system
VRCVVLDTNVILDCWVFDDPDARALKAALASRHIVAVRSVETDAELEDVLVRPRFGLDEVARRAILEQWQSHSTRVEVAGAAPIRCADPHDQKFLDLALATRASALFTKDKELLATATHAMRYGLIVLTPRAAGSVLFLEDDVA